MISGDVTAGRQSKLEGTVPSVSQLFTVPARCKQVVYDIMIFMSLVPHRYVGIIIFIVWFDSHKISKLLVRGQ